MSAGGPGRLHLFAYEFWWFGLKQAWSCLFGGTLLALILLTAWWVPPLGLARYDLLFLLALLVQAGLLLARLETWREAGVILVFHVLATAMEVFKTAPGIGSWSYPHAFVLGIGGAPLFAGFMYSAVGSYIARVWRVFAFRFTALPGRGPALVLVTLIYANFFTHHYLVDLRWLLIAAALWLFRSTWVHFRIRDHYRRMPLLLGWLLVALFVWFAENLATWAGLWLYPSQRLHWHPVPMSKLTAWFMLMQLSFVLVWLLHPREPDDGSTQPGPAA